MAVIQCPDCGKEVSTFAATCPHCGYPMQDQPPPPVPPPVAAKKGTSPWNIIGWIVLAFLALVIYSCTNAAMKLADSQAASPSSGGSSLASAASTNYSVRVVDQGCEESAGGRYTRIRATVENSGTETIPFAKAFFEGTGSDGTLIEAADTYFSPTSIPPGARASADVMLQSAGIKRCGLVRIQGSGGEPVTLQ